MKILVVGSGSIAQRHIRNLKGIGPDIEIGVLRQSSRALEEGNWSSFVSHFWSDGQEALSWQPDAAIVANAASAHIPIALRLARTGAHLFIEKPLAITLEGVEELVGLGNARGLVIMVGYMLRFFPPLQVIHRSIQNGTIGRVLSIQASVGQYLPDWRPNRPYAQGVTAQRALGGGVILELSHELDYVRWIVGGISSVTAQSAIISDLAIDVEDVADILLEFTNGAFGCIHLDMLDRARHRGCRIVGSEGTITWELSDDNVVRLYHGAKGSWTDLRPPAPIEMNEMYRDELKHFLDCISTHTMPIVTLEDGAQTLRIAEAVKESARRGKRMTI